MIDKKRKIIFIHIPKTGGSSIEVALNGRKDHNPDYTYRNEILSGEYKVFSIIRNPWDRVVSSFAFRKRPNAVYSQEYGVLQEFERFVYETFGRNKWLEDSMAIHELSPQLSWLTLEYDHHIGIPKIFKFDNFGTTYRQIFEYLDIPRPPKPHINKTERDHYTNFYNETTKYIVGSMYREEINMFGFKFGA